MMLNGRAPQTKENSSYNWWSIWNGGPLRNQGKANPCFTALLLDNHQCIVDLGFYAQERQLYLAWQLLLPTLLSWHVEQE